MSWNPFGKKPSTMGDEQKIKFADFLAGLLDIQLSLVRDKPVTSYAGGPKRRAIGYVYGYVDAALRAQGWDMADTDIGLPITFQTVRRLWPGCEREFTDFLVCHIRDPDVIAGAMHGGQQYLDWYNKKTPDASPMGLARYIMLDD